MKTQNQISAGALTMQGKIAKAATMGRIGSQSLCGPTRVAN
ncbi:MAG TPA: hypothetical protein VGY56_21190 [Verrucomicrobiae bacterium]|nr:hypothetical protein [Verrucomicrobiae bacterium]